MRHISALLGAALVLAAAGFPGGLRAGEAPAGEAGKWTKVDAGVKQDLLAVHFPTAEKGWAVGREGLVLASADGGKTWARQESGLAKADLYAVFFLDAEHGWACGDIGDGPQVGGHVVMNRPLTAAAVISTADGGKTWARHWAPTNFILTGIRMLDRERGCMVSHGGPAHKDGDTLAGAGGGAKWASRRAFRALHALTFVNAQTGFAVGTPVSVGFMPAPNDPLYLERNCRIIRTADGGKTWGPLKHPDLKRNELVGVSFAGEKVGWACGTGGTVLRTADGGDSWELQDPGVTNHLRDVFAADERRAWVVGYEGVILATADGGKTWKRQESGTDAQLRRVWFTAAGQGVAVGFGGTVLHWEGPAGKP